MGQVTKGQVSKMTTEIVVEENEVIICADCDYPMDVDSGDYFADSRSGEYYCIDCGTTCLDCEEQFHYNRDNHRFKEVCRDCEDDWFYCDKCDAVVHADVVQTVDNYETWCESCACDYAQWCERCGMYETDPCRSRGSSFIHEYNYDPYIGWQYNGMEFDASKSLYQNVKQYTFFGVELEVELRDEDESLDQGATLVLNHFNTSCQIDHENIVYCKEDGSLDHGFEIVTQPMTFDYAMGMDWSILKKLSALGFRSWDGGSCGLHVHVSRLSFKDRQHLWKFTQLINSNVPQCAKLAGRDNARWSNYDKKGSSKIVLGKYAPERYQAVNLSNSKTVEVRIFRGSLRPERIPMAIQFVDSCMQYTKDLTINQVARGGLAWSEYDAFVRSHPERYKELITLIDEKVR